VSGSQSNTKPKPFAVSKAEVFEAWLQVAANRGAAGIDGVELDEFEDRLQDNLYRVWNRMASGSYFPAAVRSVEIPKPDSGVRVLGVPTVADRVAQTVAARRLEAAAEPRFHADSFGFRPCRSAHDAVRQCRDRCWQRHWVVDLDIARFFDSVDWELLMKAVESLEVPSWVVLYVRRWLAVDAIAFDGGRSVRDRGTPQGGPVSPVLANLFLHYAFDTWIDREFPTVRFERYADDVIVHCASLRQAEEVLAAIADRMAEVGLALHPEKTKIVYCGMDRAEGWKGPRSFTFLGFEFRRRGNRTRDGKMRTTFSPAVSKAAKRRMNRVMRSWNLHRHVTSTFAEIADWVNPVVRGWMRYYGAFRRSELYPILRQLNRRILKWVRRKYKRFRPWKRLLRRWAQVTAEWPDYFAHWQWVTSFVA
jgi:RNA-directed DNA polymerase